MAFLNLAQNRAQFDSLVQHALEDGEPPVQDFWELAVVREEVDANLLPHKLYTSHPWYFRQELRAQFIGEGKDDQGIADWGGGRRIMFSLAVKASFSAGELWTKDSDSDYFRIKKGADLMALKEFGFLVGLAHLNSVIIPLPLPVLFFQKLKDARSDWPHKVEEMIFHLKQVHHSFATTLQSLWKEPGQIKEGDDTWLWTVPVQDGEGEVNWLPVCPGGETKIVKSCEVKEYVKEAVNYLLYKHNSDEFEAFSEGFHIGPSSRLYHLVEAEDLKVAMCGIPDIDWNQMRRKTKYQQPYSDHHPLITALWDFVATLDRGQSKRLLSLW